MGEDNMKLEQQIIEMKKKLIVLGDNSNKNVDITQSFKDGSVMKLFQNTDFIINNCGKINEFSSKVIEICKNQNNSNLNTNGGRQSIIRTNSRITKRKNINNGTNTLSPDNKIPGTPAKKGDKNSPVDDYIKNMEKNTSTTPINNQATPTKKGDKNSPMDDYINNIAKDTDKLIPKNNQGKDGKNTSTTPINNQATLTKKGDKNSPMDDYIKNIAKDTDKLIPKNNQGKDGKNTSTTPINNQATPTKKDGKNTVTTSTNNQATPAKKGDKNTAMDNYI